MATTFKNKHLRNDDYFAIIAFCSHSILLTNHAKNGPVGASYNLEQGMKDLLLGVYVVCSNLKFHVVI